MTTPPDEPYGERPPYSMPAFDVGFEGIDSLPAPPGEWVGPPLAVWPLRFVSGIVDLTVLTVPWWLLAKLDAGGWGFLTFLGLMVYVAGVQGRTGRSPGKQLLKLRLLREADGRPLGFAGSFGRMWLHLVDAMTCGVGFLWPIWDNKRQTFADKIIESVVIRG
jgi:uncharacterized RDD family membrane protein YckC